MHKNEDTKRKKQMQDMDKYMAIEIEQRLFYFR